MTLEEAQAILRRRPEYVREAGCDSVRGYIEQYLDPHGWGTLQPGEDAHRVAENVLADMQAAGEEPTPVSVDELAAYFLVVTAEKGVS
ncbi:MAG: hypothetical protein H5U04_12365 [Firmicutes bacterium]|nr:hypothetical protein [Bacillota bacterium]